MKGRGARESSFRRERGDEETRGCFFYFSVVRFKGHGRKKERKKEIFFQPFRKLCGKKCPQEISVKENR